MTRALVAFDLDGTLLRGPAAVGDSSSDADLLAAASLRFFVGAGPPPPVTALEHRPGGNIASIAREMLRGWAE